MFPNEYSLPDASTEIKLRAERWRELAQWYRDAAINAFPLGGDKAPLTVNLDNGKPLFGVDDKGKPNAYSWGEWMHTACQGKLFDGLWNNVGIVGHCRGVGIVCGAASRHLVVLDFDKNKETGALPSESDVHAILADLDLPPSYAWQARTASGGWHVMLRCHSLWKGDGIQKRIASHGGAVELFAKGKYVVAVGSFNDELGSVYTWRFGVPEDAPAGRSENAIMAAYERHTTPKPSKDTKPSKTTQERMATPLQPFTGTPTGMRAMSAWAKAGIERELAALRSTAEGERNDAVNRHAFNIAALWRDAAQVGIDVGSETELMAAIYDAGVATGLPKGEVTSALNSGWKFGIADGNDRTATLREVGAGAEAKALAASSGTPATSNGTALAMELKRQEYAADAELQASEMMAEEQRTRMNVWRNERRRADSATRRMLSDDELWAKPQNHNGTPDEWFDIADMQWLVSDTAWMDGDSWPPSADAAPEYQPHWTPMSLDALMAEPDKEWLVHRMFGRGDLVMLFGLPNSGKTFVGIDLAMACAAGADFAGRFPVSGKLRTLYAAGEGKSGLKNRFAAALEYHNLSAADRQNIMFMDGTPQLSDDQNLERHINTFVADMEWRDEPLPDIIILDTLSTSTYGMEENSSKDMNLAFDGLKTLADRWQCCVVIIHHTGKNGEASRGSSAMDGSLDAAFLVERKDKGKKKGDGDADDAPVADDTRRLVCRKMRDEAFFDNVHFRLMSKGTSAICEWYPDGSIDEPAISKSGEWRNRVLDALHKLPELMAVSLSYFYEACAVEQSERTSIARALNALEADGLVASQVKDATKEQHNRWNPMVYRLTDYGRAVTSGKTKAKPSDAFGEPLASALFDTDTD